MKPAILPLPPFGWIAEPFSVPYVADRIERTWDLPRGCIATHQDMRLREIAWPRQALMLALRQERSMTNQQIGNRLGKRDPSTVCHGCQAAAARLQTDKSFAGKYRLIAEWCRL